MRTRSASGTAKSDPDLGVRANKPRRARTIPGKAQSSPLEDSAAAAVVRVKKQPQTPSPSTPSPRQKKKDATSHGDVEEDAQTPRSKMTNAERKLASFKTNFSSTPFPNHPLPTHADAEHVAELLRVHHGYTALPHRAPPREDRFGGCGNVASVLDALVRTVLSCNTSNSNSAAAHRSMCDHFGKANYAAIHEASVPELAQSIKCGGLHERKAKIIKGILTATMERHGRLSLDHLHSPSLSTDEILAELLGFDGVGPKVASCVVAFCIGREECAVDTHVYRLSKKLGWVPERATRDQTYYHLAARLPSHLKFAIHTFLIKHGKRCPQCSARGFATEREPKPRRDDGHAPKAEAQIKAEPDVKQVEAGPEVKSNGLGTIKKENKPEESSDSEFEPRGKDCPLRQAGLFKRGRKALETEKDEKPHKKQGMRATGPKPEPS